VTINMGSKLFEDAFGVILNWKSQPIIAPRSGVLNIKMPQSSFKNMAKMNVTINFGLPILALLVVAVLYFLRWLF